MKLVYVLSVRILKVSDYKSKDVKIVDCLPYEPSFAKPRVFVSCDEYDVQRQYRKMIRA